MTVSMLSVVPEPSSGTAPCTEPDPTRLWLFARHPDIHRQALARAARPDFPAWLDHVRPVAACARPIRLSGTITTYRSIGSGTAGDPVRYARSTTDTAHMPDGVIYKRCGNRRSGMCPSCSKIYQRDAYQIIRAGIVGGKGVPETVSQHTAIFSTFTAPGFGAVHHRIVKRHTCGNRARCDCRAEPCHADRTNPTCGHGRPQTCYARHENGDRRIGTPICLDCYDYDAHVVWNNQAGELWRRTKQAIDRELAHLCKAKGIGGVVVGVSPATGRPIRKAPAQTSCGKAAEFQARAVVHFHALIRLDGIDPADPDAIVPPPTDLTVEDLDHAIKAAAASQAFHTPPHPDAPGGWRIAWGEQIYNRPLTLSGHGEVTDGMVAGYLAKYATKSTEVTGHTSARLTEATIDRYADMTGGHVQRLLAACWRLGRPIRTELLQSDYARLLATIASTALGMGRLEPNEPAQTVMLDRLHTTVEELVDVAAAAPKPLRHRLRHTAPTSGSVPPWHCPACGTVSRTMQCRKCLAPQHDQAQQLQRLLFLLLLSGTVQAAGEETNPYAGLRRWAHMLGFGGHFFSQSKRYSVRFRVLRDTRIVFRRNQTVTPVTGQADTDRGGEETTLIINSLTLAGIGWHTTADAMLANTSSALAREHQQTARQQMCSLAV